MQNKFGENAIWVYEVLRYVVHVSGFASLSIKFSTVVLIGTRVSFPLYSDGSPDFYFYFGSQREGKS